MCQRLLKTWMQYYIMQQDFSEKPGTICKYFLEDNREFKAKVKSTQPTNAN